MECDTLSHIIDEFGLEGIGQTLIEDISSIDEKKESSKDEKKMDETILGLLKSDG